MSDDGEWIPLIRIEQLEAGDITEVQAQGRTFAVYDTIDGITVSDARCTHAGANLCLGYFDGKTVECPLHQGLFDSRTGAALAAPALRPLRMVECQVRDDTVMIRRN
jgi:nitrite reductase/ring-hydroxylating ferredoxin subunit